MKERADAVSGFQLLAGRADHFGRAGAGDSAGRRDPHPDDADDPATPAADQPPDQRAAAHADRRLQGAGRFFHRHADGGPDPSAGFARAADGRRRRSRADRDRGPAPGARAPDARRGRGGAGRYHPARHRRTGRHGRSGGPRHGFGAPGGNGGTGGLAARLYPRGAGPGAGARRRGNPAARPDPAGAGRQGRCQKWRAFGRWW
ncbi:hypothetical protein XINFAN_01945 [Pseudogemmobacter humi]|uniref:Uncharacterized protein n=1 Tax=Pseudogemmobacter humi TaxID=2483812 RepID=A0A3P5XBZ5_9RHOB|nr:hypothetical protein XINFAN_01945 [Pseudogemmobacter humi]